MLHVCLASAIGLSSGSTAVGQNVGLGVEPKSTTTVGEKVSQMSREFMANVRLNRRRKKDITHFDLTIDDADFLGESAVTLLSQNDSRKIFLVLLHYNIPTLKAFLIPGRYSFARFSTRFVVYPVWKNESKEQRIKDDHAPRKVDLIGIYPVNDLLGIQHVDKGTTSAQLEPKFMAASGASLNYTKERSDQYNFELPKVIGSADRFGKAAWTYYPAKLQPLIMGSKTAIAIISFDTEADKSFSPEDLLDYRLRMECTLDYQLKRLSTLPGIERRNRDTLEFLLSSAPPLPEFLKIHEVDIPDDVLSKIESAFTDKHQVTVNGGKNDYAIDSTAGKIYRLDESGAHDIDLSR